MEGKYWIIIVVILGIMAGLLGPDIYKLLYPKKGYIITKILPFGSTIYYQLPKPFNSGWEINQIKEADPATFEIINDLYAKDKNHFFYSGKVEKDIDLASFQALQQVYSKDKTAVYYSDHENKNPFSMARLEKIQGADVPTFQELESGYGKDKNWVYINGKILENTDSPSFKVLKYGYAKDKETVYYYGQKITEADAGSFQTLDKGPDKYYAQDQNGIYNFGKFLKVDPHTFDYPTINFLPTSTP